MAALMGDRRLLHFGHLASMAVMIRFVILWIFAASAVAQELSIPIGEIKDDEVRLVQICNEMKEALREFYPAVDAIEDANEQEKYFRPSPHTQTTKCFRRFFGILVLANLM
jgi:hypothetical protein